MCAITGWIDFKQDLTEKEGILDKMAETLERRGPDDRGAYLSHEAAILHSRLAVVDIENGKQPMTACVGGVNYILTYNGELYNTEEIRKELYRYGYCFKGHSDTEVLLYAFCQWGKDCLKRLNGIFAFGVWNDRDKTLFLARDPIGVKPLFYYRYLGGLLFASEIKTLLANPLVKPVVKEEGLKEIFLMGPGRTPGCGVISGIEELKPGQCALFDKEGLMIRTYWEIRAAEHADSLEQTVEKVRFLICDGVKRQLVSDVPLCCFLSGGLDSSVISAIASQEYKKEGKALTTYSVDYTGNAEHFHKSHYQPDPDSRYIGLMSGSIGSNHREVVLDNEKLAEALDDATRARDLPGMADIDSSLLLFCQEIKKDFTVSVSGECADEIFGGYPWYFDDDILFFDSFPWSRSLQVRTGILKKGVLSGDPGEYVKERYFDTLRHTDKLPGESRRNARMREMFMLNFNWFMQTLLDRKDRMSMYWGLEVRVPFCDHRIVEYAFNMPWEYKALGGREKGIVREAMKGFLPEPIRLRKKSPYPKTHNPIYFQAVRNKLLPMLDSGDSILSEIIEKEEILKLMRSPDGPEHPWYGQLMRSPQILAYLLQVDRWFKQNGLTIG